MTASEAERIAAEFCELAEQYGAQVWTVGGTVKVQLRFEAGSQDGYVDAESKAWNLMTLLPQRKNAGSTWGTDGLSIGGYTGLMGGYMRLNRSGVYQAIVKRIERRIAS